MMLILIDLHKWRGYVYELNALFRSVTHMITQII